MPATIQINIPDEIVAHYHNLEAVEREVYVDFILHERQKGTISLGRAAELLGISYVECYELLVAKGLPITNVSQEEQEDDYRRNKEFMSTYHKP